MSFLMFFTFVSTSVLWAIWRIVKIVSEPIVLIPAFVVLLKPDGWKKIEITLLLWPDIFEISEIETIRFSIESLVEQAVQGKTYYQ